MTSFSVNMSPLQPSTVVATGLVKTGQSSGTEDSIRIPMVPKSYQEGFQLGLRKSYEASMFSVLLGSDISSELHKWLNSLDNIAFEELADYLVSFDGDNEDIISWERTNFSSGGNKFFKDSITIEFKNPTGEVEGMPYWSGTVIAAKNPNTLQAHYPPIVIYKKNDAYVVSGDIGNSEKWHTRLTPEKHHTESQPICVPGEYIVLRWGLNINGKYFEYSSSVRYETPLFTGGQIISVQTAEKIEDTTYTVKIFSVEVSGIKPSDLYMKYAVGKWVYLMKNVSLIDGKQEYGNNSIAPVKLNEENGEWNYKIVPFNFGGPMQPNCAVPREGAIHIDSATRFADIFDMISYQEGVLLSVDYENDEATADIPGGSIHTLPIFYYCDSSDTIKGGASPFLPGDYVLVCKERGNWDSAKIIGFPEGPKTCGTTIQFTIGEINTTSGFTSMVNERISALEQELAYLDEYKALMPSFYSHVQALLGKVMGFTGFGSVIQQ